MYLSHIFDADCLLKPQLLVRQAQKSSQLHTSNFHLFRPARDTSTLVFDVQHTKQVPCTANNTLQIACWDCIAYAACNQLTHCLFYAEASKSTGLVLYWRQFWALFLKRAISAKRDSLAAILQILVPILLVLLALEAGNASMTRAQQPELVISR